ncbi:MAG: hypothetical protein EA397_02180 [Deltaproteobacteria bacterium]|nr:MAG: hypothetical protein EA397_02180 [Deltaproteobacteria bacterium]
MRPVWVSGRSLFGIRAWLASRPIRAGSTRLGWVYLVAVVLLWGSGPLAIGLGVGDEGGFGPLWLGSSRLLVAGGLLVVLSGLRGGGLWPTGGLWRPASAGLIGWSVGNGAQIFAQTEASASLAALIVGLSPAFALGLDALWARRRPAAHHLLAVALGLGGLALLVGGGAGDETALWAIGALLLAAVGWAAAAVSEQRRPVLTSPTLSAGWQMLWGGAGLTVAALASGELLPAPTLVGGLAWVWLTLPCAALGFLTWVEVLRRLPVAIAMTQPTLSTIVAVWLGVRFMGDSLSTSAGLGMGVTILGAALAAIPSTARLRIPTWRWRRGSQAI